jgi:hypothetical protein
VVQFGGNHGTEHGITEKFQTFVIPAAGAAMRQGLLQQLRILKTVAQVFFQ